MPHAPSPPVALAEALPPSAERFAALALALGSAIRRDETALAELRAIEDSPRPGGRGHGLEWVVAETEQTIALLREAEALLVALAPHADALHQLAGRLPVGALAA